MFKGFNLKLEELFPLSNNYYKNGESDFQRVFQRGNTINEENKGIIQSKLELFLRADNKLDGSSIKEEWFPRIKADVFISHSHKNEEQAIALSGWLKENFGLNSFIDSLVWGYAPSLVDKFNNTYNIIGGTPPNNVTYGYKTAKYISSHVDLMLSTALNSMIDHCEALIFLNTPFSTGETIQNGAFVEIESPWIYSELETSRIVREKLDRKRHKLLIKSFSSGGVIGMEKFNESKLPPIIYDTDIRHLYHLTDDNLTEWNRLYNHRRNSLNINMRQYPLDTLYDLMNID